MTLLEEFNSVPVTWFSAPPVAATYLEARCQFALAKVMLSFDRARANFLAERAFRAVVNIDHDEAMPGIPWELRSEPALVFAFEQSRELAARRRPYEEARRARSAAADAARGQQRRQEEEALRRVKTETPSAEVLLAELQSGNQLTLNGHSLEWDEEMGVLAGDNAYGVDYYWGSMTLASVARWRAAMLAGDTIGPCPHGDDDGDAYEQDDDEIDWPEYSLYEEHQSLQFMCQLVFTPDLQGLVPADASNS